MLARVADKIVDVRHYAGEHICSVRWNWPHAGKKPRFAIFFPGFIHRFHYAVGKNENQITRLKLRASGRIGNFVFGEERRPQGRATDGKPLDFSRRAAQYRIVMPAVHVRHLASLDIYFREEGRSKAEAFKTVRPGVAFEARYNFIKRSGCCGK